MRSLISSISILTLLATQAVAGPYSVNDAFIANETQMGGPIDPNGAYVYGYTFDPTTPSAISTFGLVHSSAMNGFNNTGAGIQGYYFPNDASVPAVLGNITNSAIPTNFATTMQAGQLLLHPGGTSPSAGTPPFADADIQYTIAATGNYDISGSFQALSSGDAGIGVYVNGAPLLTGFAGSQNTVTPFSFIESLTAGSTVAFVVSPGPGGIGSNSTGLFANIAPVPEPSTWVAIVGMCGVGLIGFVRYRRSAKRAG